MLGEAALVLIVVAVPLIISPRSKHILDVKDFALGVSVMVGLSMVVMASLARGRIGWVKSRLNALVAAFLLWAAATLIYSQYRYATVSDLGRLAGNVAVYWLVILSVRDTVQVRRVIAAAAVAAFGVAGYALMQVAGHDFWTWDVPRGRVFSFLGNATYLASYVVLVAPLLVAAAWPVRVPRENSKTSSVWFSSAYSVVLLLAAALLLITLYFTVSLSPTIGLTLGGVIAFLLVLIRGKRRVLRVAIPGFLAAVLLFAGAGAIAYRSLPKRQQRRIQDVARLRDPAGKERVAQWRTALELFRERPLLGRGYGTFRIHSLERLAPVWYADLGKSTEKMFVPSYAHNEYLQVLSGTGVIGGLVFILLLGAALSAAVLVALRHPDRQWGRLGLAGMVAMTAFLFQNFFGVTFRQPGAVTFFWFALGIVTVSVARLPAPGEDEVAAPRVRALTFRRTSGAGLVAPGLLLLVALVALGWVMGRPVKGNRYIRSAERAAKLGEFAEAAWLADEGARLNPWDLTACYISAYAWGTLGNHEKALAANKKALALLPGNASVYYNLGVSYKELGRHEEARENFERAVELMPTSARQHFALAEALLTTQEYDAAIEHAQEAIRLSEGDYRPYALAAEIETRRGNIEEAADYLGRALEMSPEDERLWREYLKVLMAIGEREEALQACRKWLALEPDSPEAYSALVGLLVRRGGYEEALAELKKAIRAGRGAYHPYLLAADIETERGNLEAAESHIRQGVSRFPGELRLQQALVQNLMRQRKAKEAISAAERWLELEPESSVAYEIIGICRYNLGDYKAARAPLEKALDLDPKSHNARLTLAYTYGRLGEPLMATRHLTYLAEKAPQTREGREAKKVLEQGSAAGK